MDAPAAERLIEVVGKWAFYMGIAQKTTSDDILVLCRFLMETYPYVTVEDVELAIKYKLKGHFPDVEFFGVLSPVFMSGVLNGYLDIKQEKMTELFERRDKSVKPEPVRMTPEESLKIITDAIRASFLKFKETGFVFDPFSMVYNFCRKTGRIDISLESSPEALSFAQSWAERERVAGKPRLVVEELGETKPTPDEAVMSRYVRNYVVGELFKKITDIEKFVSEISVSEAE